MKNQNRKCSFSRYTYEQAVEWIAFNDGAGDEDATTPEVVASMITVGFCSDLFGVPALEVALDVVAIRNVHFERKAFLIKKKYDYKF